MSQNIELHVIAWAAEECERQKSGEYSVYNMCNAYQHMYRWSRQSGYKLTEGHVQTLGWLVEPEKNALFLRNYRTVPVTFKDGSTAIDSSLIRRCMSSLIDWDCPSPEEFYKEFEDIHPFIDGNGRVGSILYNYLRNSLNNPVAPPDMF